MCVDTEVERAGAIVASVAVHALLVGVVALAVMCRNDAPRAHRSADRLVMVDLAPTPIPSAPTPTPSALPPIPSPSIHHQIQIPKPKPTPKTEKATTVRSDSDSETELGSGSGSGEMGTGDGEMGDGEMGDGEMGDGEMGDGEMGDGEMGTGDGKGSGQGHGRGLGKGGRPLGAVAARPTPPPSKARKARLIWPKRQGDPEEGRTFTCLLTVDEEGFVVGVKMVGSGPTNRREERATDAVWRFRYEPALDDAGRAIKTQVEQPFILLN